VERQVWQTRPNDHSRLKMRFSHLGLTSTGRPLKNAGNMGERGCLLAQKLTSNVLGAPFRQREPLRGPTGAGEAEL
jgi:hypothetical protein